MGKADQGPEKKRENEENSSLGSLARKSVLGEMTLFSKEEVAQHNSEESCWLIVDDSVYDVTPFLDQHPAGPKPLLRRAGGDATRDFYFHSKAAQKSWQKYKIGYVEGSQRFCNLM